jgi:hypothetical protein
MPPCRSSALYQLLLLALVGSVAALAFTLTGRLGSYVREAVAVDVRYGTLAERGLSVAVASAPDVDPARLAAGRYLASSNAALIVFEGAPSSVEVSGRAADLAWLDGGMAVRYLDPARADGAVVPAPLKTSFVLVLPAGRIGELGLGRGERLELI